MRKSNEKPKAKEKYRCVLCVECCTWIANCYAYSVTDQNNNPCWLCDDCFNALEARHHKKRNGVIK